MVLSGENCGLPTQHGLLYTAVCNFSISKNCCNKFVILLQLCHRSLYSYMNVRIYGLPYSLLVKNMVFSIKVKEISLLKFLKFEFVTYHFQ